MNHLVSINDAFRVIVSQGQMTSVEGPRVTWTSVGVFTVGMIHRCHFESRIHVSAQSLLAGDCEHFLQSLVRNLVATMVEVDSIENSFLQHLKYDRKHYVFTF